MGLKTKPYNLLLIVGVIFILLSFLNSNRSGTIDIHLHDTYFIIAHTQILLLLAFIAVFIWTLYILTYRFLFSKVLTWTHVIITLLTLFLLTWILYFSYGFPNPTARRYVDYSLWTSYNTYADSKATAILSIVLLLGQIIYIVNVIGGIFKRRT